MNATVEAIHKDFDFDFMELIRDGNQIAMVERHAPPGISVNDFAGHVLHWRAFYPGQNFIPFSQVVEICLKYGLAFGPLWAFIDTIPDHNAGIMQSFKFRHQDERFIAPPVNPKMTGKTVNLASAWIPGDVAQSNVVFFPVFENLGVLQHNGRHTVISSHVIGGNSIDVMWDDPNVIAWVESKSVPGGFSCRGRIKANNGVFGSPQPRQLSTHVVPMVVAPFKWFSMIGLKINSCVIRPAGGGLELKPTFANPTRWAAFIQGGRNNQRALENKLIEDQQRAEQQRVEAIQRAEERRLADIDDPVILHPLPTGGFLEITKWGPEAYIPELQNPSNN